VLQIAWIDATSENPGDTAHVTIRDPIEHRIEVFHADTGIPTTANQGDIVDRATELLRMGLRSAQRTALLPATAEPRALGQITA
jgi:hypothetical protein